MNRRDAVIIAHDLIWEHGLTGWTFAFDRARRRGGACHFHTRTITLSGPLTDLYSEQEVRDILIHEVAHALVGPGHHHDRAWKAKARSMGGSGSAYLPQELPKPEPNWIGTCPRCGWQNKLFSAPRRVASCPKCSNVFHLELIFTWTHHGQPAIPPGAYAKELRLIESARQATSSKKL